MRFIPIYAFLLLNLLAGAGERLIDSNFGTSNVPIRSKDDLITGVLPEGWIENSSGWCKARAECSIHAQEGEQFLRINVTQLPDGRMQLAYHGIPDVADHAYFRLNIKIRNLSGGQIEFGLRMKGSPYKMYWSERGAFSDGWREYEHTFELKKNDKPMGFWLITGAVGMVDVAHIRLERMEAKDLEAELKAKYPDGGPDNLFRNSRFPLGLPAGWMLSREYSDGDEVNIDAAAEMVAPSGVPPLRIQAKRNIWLHSEPFGVVCPVEDHVFRASVCGAGKWKFGAYADTKHISTMAHQLTDRWQRITLRFKPRLLARLYVIRIEGQGTLRMDSIRVGPASKSKASEPDRRPEVALALPGSITAKAGVHFANEPADIKYCVSGARNGDVLRARIVNVYGEEKVLPPVTVPGGRFVKSGKLGFAAFEKRPFGPHRVETWIEREGKRVSPVGETVAYRLRRPRYWGKDAPNSPFGVHFNSTNRRIAMMKAIGVNWVRLHDSGIGHIGWFWLEPEKGKWRFQDEAINRYRAQKIKIFAELGTAPKWASYLSKSDTGRKGIAYHDRYFQPLDLKDYARYCRKVISRYKGVISDYFVWNEPWIHAWWGVGYDKTKGGRGGYIASKEPQKDFVRMMKVAFEEARSVDPTIRVSGFNTTNAPDWGAGNISGSDWTQGVLAAAADGAKILSPASAKRSAIPATIGASGPTIVRST